MSVTNGYLYLTFEDDDLKLHQYSDEIYFTADGEALTLKKDVLNYKGISTKKINLDVEQVIETIKLNKDCLNAYYITVRHLSNVLYKTLGFNKALSFIDRTVEIDDSFNIIYKRLGRRLYTYGELDRAKKCYLRLLEINRTDNSSADMLEKIEQKMRAHARAT